MHVKRKHGRKSCRTAQSKAENKELHRVVSNPPLLHLIVPIDIPNNNMGYHAINLLSRSRPENCLYPSRLSPNIPSFLTFFSMCFPLCKIGQQSSCQSLNPLLPPPSIFLVSATGVSKQPLSSAFLTFSTTRTSIFRCVSTVAVPT